MSVGDERSRAAMRAVLTDVVFMEQVGMWPVLVHGGGARISEEMKRAGVEPEFVQGHRRTTPEVMRIVARVLVEEISSALCDVIEDVGGRAIPLNGRASSFLMGKKRRLPEAPDADLGLVGEVTRVDREMCYRVADGGLIPVVAPVARFDPDEAPEEDRGEGADVPASETTGVHLLNINGDSAAMAVAAGLGAEKLVFMSDVPGVLRDPEDEGSLISSLREADVAKLIDEGVIAGGMLPKVRACLEGIDAGVKKAHIVSALTPHALLLEIFTDEGVGTEIVK
jgi:acetylglutamate kinase